MLPTTLEALLVISLFALPGYVFTTLARRSVAFAWDTTDLRLILTVLSSGAIIQLVIFVLGAIAQAIASQLFGPTAVVAQWLSTDSVAVLRYFRCAALLSAEISLQDRPFCDSLLNNQVPIALWTLVSCIVIPSVAGAAWGQILIWPRLDKQLDKIGLGDIDRTPTAWDHVAQVNTGLWVRVHLKDEKGIVAGQYGPASFGSLDPKRPDIYLQEAWLTNADGNIEKRVANSRGVWIAHDVMSHVHFLEGLDEPYESTDTSPKAATSKQFWSRIAPRSIKRLSKHAHSRGAGHGQTRDATKDGTEAVSPSADNASRD